MKNTEAALILSRFRHVATVMEREALHRAILALKHSAIPNEPITKAPLADLDRDAIESPADLKIVAIGDVVMMGPLHVAKARSANFAKRIANALNQYRPNSRGQ